MSPLRAITLTVATLAIVGIVVAYTATNNVSQSNAGSWSRATDANDLKPAACNWTLAATPVTNGNGTAANELILGTSGNDVLNGGGGRDCFLGGGGNDTITGNNRKAGNTLIHAGDYCDGGAGVDTVTTVKVQGVNYSSCDTEVNIP